LQAGIKRYTNTDEDSQLIISNNMFLVLIVDPSDDISLHATKMDSENPILVYNFDQNITISYVNDYKMFNGKVFFNLLGKKTKLYVCLFL
jgi:hypothetical protein